MGTFSTEVVCLFSTPKGSVSIKQMLNNDLTTQTSSSAQVPKDEVLERL